MPLSTNSLQQTFDFCQPFIPQNLDITGWANQPVLSSANMVLQQFLSPPFAWPWNRNSLSFTAVAGQADYVVTPPVAFGFIELASITQTNQSLPTMEIPDKTLVFMSPTQTGLPESIAPVLENSDGTVTFRVSPAPDNLRNGETITVIYQQAPPSISQMQSTGGTWSPLPDKFSFVYQTGFLYWMMLYAEDPQTRAIAQTLREDFLAGLLAVSEGLDATEKESFQELWIRRDSQRKAAAIKTSLGSQARVK